MIVARPYHRNVNHPDRGSISLTVPERSLYAIQQRLARMLIGLHTIIERMVHGIVHGGSPPTN